MNLRPWTMSITAMSIIAGLIMAGCSSDAEPEASATPTPTTGTGDAPSPTRSRAPSPTPQPTTAAPAGPVAPTGNADVVATDLDVPWDLEFLDDGTALVTERNTARVRRVEPNGELTDIGEVPGVSASGEGGLLGIAHHQNWLYVMFTAGDDNRVVRMAFDGESLGEPEVIVDGLPKAGIHNGGRIVFGPDGMLYIGAGDANNGENAQDVDSPAGKILRVTPEGDVPDDNPFDGSPVWSYGHRNVQGLAFDDEGRLWASEFGQRTWDELNLIEAGENYGWPIVEGIADDDEFTDPVLQWSTADASPSGIAYVRDTIFMAGLRGQRLWQIPVPDGSAGEPQEFFTGEYGRLRHAELAPDGTLWLLTNNTDGRNPDGPGPDDDQIVRVSLE
ncbi:MAG TPA: PQQ-dependent sugar dehydrogenase [Jiangellales bacterium]|nr:PQQ-dependent sugar dehydrogenase [Jiangellales bacterium]